MSMIDKQKTYEVLTDYYHHSTDIQHKALREALDRVPSVETAADTISRKKTLERLTNISYNLCKTQAEDKIIEYAKTMVITMPSVLPEFIRCKECKHWFDIDDGRQKHRMCADIYGDWYCADAERRADERPD